MKLLRSSPALTQYNSNTSYNTQHYGDNCTQQWLRDDSAQRLYRKYSKCIHLLNRMLRIPKTNTMPACRHVQPIISGVALEMNTTQFSYI